MKKLLGHIKVYVMRGLWALVPLALSFFALRIIYVSIDRQVLELIERCFGFSMPGLGILLLIVMLYFLGVVASNVLGNKALGLVERITERIPLVKTTYQVGKQLASSLSVPQSQVFKRAVLVDYLKPGMWTIGFVTGSLIDNQRHDEKLLKVYIPTPPNPTSGTVVVVRESDTRDPGWRVDEAMKMVISGGILGPEEIRPTRNPDAPAVGP